MVARCGGPEFRGGVRFCPLHLLIIRDGGVGRAWEVQEEQASKEQQQQPKQTIVEHKGWDAPVFI